MGVPWNAGNDFYGSIGDVFGCHAVVNPTMESELSMLAKYGPNVDPRILHKLVHGFGELRRLSDEGKISYPFSKLGDSQCLQGRFAYDSSCTMYLLA